MSFSGDVDDVVLGMQQGCFIDMGIYGCFYCGIVTKWNILKKILEMKCWCCLRFKDEGFLIVDFFVSFVWLKLK